METVYALLVLLLLLAVIWWKTERPSGREKFVSPDAEEVAAQARELFEQKGGKVPYREYREKVKGGDPVQFDRVRKLYRKGRLVPEEVEKIL